MAWLTLIITIPVTLFAVIFAISNVDDVTVRLLWPQTELQMPLALVALGLMGLGFFLGALFVWLYSQKTRFKLWQETRRADRLDRELQALQAKAPPASAVMPAPLLLK